MLCAQYFTNQTVKKTYRLVSIEQREKLRITQTVWKNWSGVRATPQTPSVSCIRKGLDRTILAKVPVRALSAAVDKCGLLRWQPRVQLVSLHVATQAQE
ncbi:hypothetical protein BaRGS_00020578 [Batillaria attramentaria]|uniref:Uncharacterized protein n=1 Tax=Batillaria attramentaria TaxID=370345 RepID=A0ABD0KMI4_9CAEN